MENGVVFVAGVYGVGKSYLCNAISYEIGLPFYSAGDLIAERNGEMYGRNKKVIDKDHNQELLIKCIEEKISKNDIILAGHMCVFDNTGAISKIDLKQLEKMHIINLILLTADINRVYSNLLMRDSVAYSIKMLEKLMRLESEHFNALARRLRIPANIIDMTYSENDIIEMKKYIEGEGKYIEGTT